MLRLYRELTSTLMHAEHTQVLCSHILKQMNWVMEACDPLAPAQNEVNTLQGFIELLEVVKRVLKME